MSHYRNKNAVKNLAQPKAKCNRRLSDILETNSSIKLTRPTRPNLQQQELLKKNGRSGQKNNPSGSAQLPRKISFTDVDRGLGRCIIIKGKYYSPSEFKQLIQSERKNKVKK